MSRTFAVVCAAAAFLVTLAPPAAFAAPEIIASSFGPADSYDGDAAYKIQNLLPHPSLPQGDNLAQAVRFQPSGSMHLLTTTRLSIFRRNSFDPAPQITIAASDLGGGPGATLATKTLPGSIPVDTPFQTETAPPVAVDWTSSNIVLLPGQSYWLYLHYATNVPGELFWSASNPNDIGVAAAKGHSYGDPNVWNVFDPASLPAFSVLAERIPEPGSLVLAAAAALALVTAGRSSREVRS